MKTEILTNAQQLSYDSQKNYKIIDNDSTNKLCAIFCSSNGIFTNRNKKRELIENEFFEWENISKSKNITKKFGKFIFVRDVFEHCYVDGINKEINTIDGIIELCKELTKGFEVYTIGNSAGGYLASILFYSLKNAVRCYSLSGIFSLYKWTGAKNNYCFNDCLHFTKRINDEKYNKWFDITPLLRNSKETLLHFYSSNNEPDLKQYNLIKDANIYLFGFNEAVHGITVNNYDLPKLLTCSDKTLKKIITKNNKATSINKNKFSICSFGVIHFFAAQINRVFRRISKSHN